MMTATELSERVRELAERNEYTEAMYAIASAWQEASPPNLRICTLPEYPGVWAKFRLTGYPYAMRRELREAQSETDYDATLTIILRYVVEWNLLDVHGNIIPLPPQRDFTLLAEADEGLVVWLIRQFYRYRGELLSPGKN